MTDARSDPFRDGPEPDPTTRSPYSRYGAPAPLVVAAGMTFVEGLLTVLFGITEAVSLASDRLVMGLSTTVFFLVYGGVMSGMLVIITIARAFFYFFGKRHM